MALTTEHVCGHIVPLLPGSLQTPMTDTPSLAAAVGVVAGVHGDEH